jgi:phage shock protein E
MDTSWLPYALPVAFIGAFVILQQLGKISGSKARQLVKDGARLVDVRSPAEFSGGHLPGAVNVPVQEVGSRLKAFGPKDKPVVLYCASGSRSSMARMALKRAGFTQVFNLGSMGRW